MTKKNTRKTPSHKNCLAALRAIAGDILELKNNGEFLTDFQDEVFQHLEANGIVYENRAKDFDYSEYRLYNN